MVTSLTSLAALVAQAPSTYREPSTGVLVLAFVVLLAAFALWLVLAARSRPRRVPERPSSLEPPHDDPPALAGMLANRFDVPAEAPAATLVDLAARGYCSIEQFGADRIVVRIRDHQPDEPLTRYERRVLTHVRGQAVDGVVPAGALLTGDEARAERWFRSFRRDVTKDARAQGLARLRFGFGSLALLWIAVAVAYAAVAMAFATGDDVASEDTSTSWLVPVVLVGNTAFAWWIGRVTRAGLHRDTDAGLERAAQWSALRDHLEDGRFDEAPAASVAIWDRLLAYATAFGLAPTAARELSFGEEHDRRAWSREGGRWHQVRVLYPRWRPGWGESPIAALLGGAVQTAVAAFVAGAAVAVGTGRVDLDTLEPSTRIWVERGALLLGVALVPVVVFCLAKAVLGLLDLFPRVSVEGTVVRRRAFREGHWMPKPLQHLWYSRRDPGTGTRADWQRRTRSWVAVDRGDRTVILAYRVGATVHGAVQQGGRARLRVSPLLGYVKEATMLSPPPPSVAATPSELTEAAVAAAAGFADRQLDRLEAARATQGPTRDEGSSVLDRPDERGKTGRQGLDDARRRLAASGYGEMFGGLLDRAEQLLDSVPDPDAPQRSDDPSPRDGSEA